MTAKFFVCPLVWDLEGGKTVAAFVDRDLAEAVVSAAPDPPDGGWRVIPMNELELLAWLHEQRADGVSQLMLNPEVNPDNRSLSGYCLQLRQLLESGKTLKVFRHFADRRDDGGES